MAVGMVIAGEFAGWNFGLRAGPVGMMAATLLVTVFYVCFIFSYTELTTAVPHAGGPYAYARRPLGPFVGFLAGLATTLEFVFAPPAIALQVGDYVHNHLVPAWPSLHVAVGA